MRLRAVLIAFLPLAASSYAEALDCTKAVKQLELDQCAGRDFVKADDLLNETYRHVLARLEGDLQSRQLLTAAQKTWLAFRDAECAFATSPSLGGSVHPMAVATCRAKLTRDRAKMLQAYLDCPEGDIVCPLPPP